MTYTIHLVRAIGLVAALYSGVMAIPAWAASDSATYAYDSLGRLTTVTYSNGTTIVYTYDAADNRTNMTVSCASSGC